MSWNIFRNLGKGSPTAHSSQLTAHSSQLTLKLRHRFPKIKRQITSFILIVSLLLSQLLSLFVPYVYAASSPWTQTDWSGGVGASTTNQYSSASSVDATTTSGQVTLTNTEKFSNTGFESDLTGWSTNDVLWWTSGGATGAVEAYQPYGAASLTAIYTNLVNSGTNDAAPGVAPTFASTTGWTFNGSTQYLTTGITPTVTYTMLVQFSGATNNGTLAGAYLFTSGSGTEDRFYLTPNHPSTNRQYANGSTSSFLRPGAAVSSGNMAMAGKTAYLNGSSDGTIPAGSITSIGGILLGATDFTSGGGSLSVTNGSIKAAAIYNVTLSSSQVSAIAAAMANLTTLTRDTTTTYSSSAGSAKLVTGSSTGNFIQSVNVGDTNTYNLSAYARTDGSAVTSSDVQLYYNGSTVSTTYTSVGSGWYQLTGTITGANASRTYGVQVAANKTVYVDNFSLNNYASSGTLTSSIFDSGQGSNWGTLTYTATTPANTTVTVKARTSNDSGMSGATAFSSCNAITSATDISSNNCVTDTHRYIQYQLTLANSSTEVTPTFSDISTTFAAYDADAPSISLTALTPDPNSDNTPTLSGTATDSIGTVSNVQFQMDSTSGSWTACTATDGSFNSANETFSCTASTLTDGSHTMYVRATDSNSNTTSNVNASTDTFTIDATAPVSIELDNPGDNSYTNSERPSFKWKATSDATAGLSKYVLEIDNPSAGSGQVSGDFTIDSIPTSRTTDYETNKYTIHYEDFFDSDSTNNYISVYTKSHSDWDSSENDGKLREGRVSWKVKARDSVGNETLSSRTLFVDRSGPNVEFTQVNDSPFSSTSFSTTDKTPSIFGKITDWLSGGDSSKTQDENGPKVASGPKQVEVKIEKKEGLGYKLHTIYTINMDKPWYTCDGKEVTDNSKQKCDKYLPFKYTPEQRLELGTYKITISGKDKADNSSSETSFTLNITTLAHITTPEKKKIIEKETKPLKPEEKEKVQKELEITKPTEEVPISALEKALRQAQDKAGEQISQTSKSVLTATGNFIVSIFNGIGQGVRFTVDTTGKALAFVGDKAGQALVFVGKTTSNSLAALYNGTQSILALGEQAAQGGAITAGQGLTFVGQGIQEGVQAGVNTTGQILAFAGSKVGEGISSAVKTTGTLLATTGQGVNNTGKAIGRGYNQLANNAPGVTKTILTAVGSGVSTRGKAIANATNTASNAAAAVASTTVKIAQSTTSAIGRAAN